MLHHIQRSALDKLAIADTLRYGEIKPSDLDGNVFGYHLKRLVSDGYIVHDNNGSYSLTALGRDFIVHRYEDPTRSAHTIYLIVVKNGSSYLMRQRNVQPLLGYSGFIHGEPDPDTSVIEAARTRLYEKTGLSIPLTLKGSALITQFIHDELQSYSHAIILYGETDESDIIGGDETGTNSWSDPVNEPHVLPSCHDILAMIDSGDTWLERRYDIEE